MNRFYFLSWITVYDDDGRTTQYLAGHFYLLEEDAWLRKLVKDGTVIDEAEFERRHSAAVPPAEPLAPIADPEAPHQV